MKNFILALAASLLLPAIGYSQSKVKQENTTFYSVPVPNDISTSDKGSSKIVEKHVKSEKVLYAVQIKYNPISKKEAVYYLGISSDNAEINKKLAKMNSKSGNTDTLSKCYSGEKQATPDWQVLADCVVNYVQVFLK